MDFVWIRNMGIKKEGGSFGMRRWKKKLKNKGDKWLKMKRFLEERLISTTAFKRLDRTHPKEELFIGHHRMAHGWSYRGRRRVQLEGREKEEAKGQG